MLLSFLKRIEKFDRSIVHACHPLHNRRLVLLMRGITYSGSAPMWIILAAGLFILKTKSVSSLLIDQATLSLLPAFTAWGIGNCVLRPLIKRPRPFQTIAGHEALVWVPKNYSMPSTHAATSVAFFCSLWSFGQPIAFAVGLWAFLVLLSRLYLGVHYPTDLIAGAVLGWLSSIGFHFYF